LLSKEDAEGYSGGVMPAFESIMRKGGAGAISQATRFFMKDDPVHKALHAIVAKLNELQIPHAIADGMALVAHGYDRTTVDVDILVDANGLRRAHEALEGLGYLVPFQGSKNLRDTQTGVRIEFLIAGGFPGDGKPKPVAFPDPVAASVDIDGIRYVSLPNLLELKLASGLSAAHRLKDLADAQELIRVLKLPRELGAKLNSYVQAKYFELWDALAAAPEE
jgi:hypothetical protein